MVGLRAGPHKEDAPNPNRDFGTLAAGLLMETGHSPEGLTVQLREGSRGVTLWVW